MTDCLSHCGPKSESVKVVVRCRPMTEKELSDGHQPIVEMDTEQGVIELRTARPQTAGSGSSVTMTGLNGSLSGSLAFNSSADTLKQFTFDAVYDWNSKQSEIYEEVMRPLVNSVLEGFNGTIFAYGQTGTGKTYTMEGVRNDSERKGVIPNSFSQIFSHIARTTDKQYLVRASYLEIYQEEIRDLLSKDQTKRLELKERADVGVYVKDLSSFVCKSIKEIEHVMTIGNQNRSVGATNMNEHSSRSHAIFIITIEHSDVRSGPADMNRYANSNTKTRPIIDRLSANTDSNDAAIDTYESNTAKASATLANDGSGESMMEMDLIENETCTKIDMPLSASSTMSASSSSSHIRVGKLNLVDLAGSERQIKTGTAGKRQKEAIKINLSLSALGNVISALVDGKSTHIPYRDSKLTRLLQDSLGGNAKTVMIAAIGPASYNYEETLTTLRYASRAKCIRNKPRVNEDPKDALLRAFQLEIERLKYLLSVKRKPESISSGSLMSPSYAVTNHDQNSDAGALANSPSALDAEKLTNRIRQMESKLLQGGRNIVDHTNEQQRELERKTQEIAEQKRREREWRQKLAEQEENTLEVRDTCSSLQQEVELKRRKLRKLFAKLQNVRAEVRDSAEANSRERRELEELQSELLKKLKLKYVIIDNFVPVGEKNRLLCRLRYDEEGDEWGLRPKSPSSRQTALLSLHRARFDSATSDNGVKDGSDCSRCPGSIDSIHDGILHAAFQPRDGNVRSFETIHHRGSKKANESKVDMVGRKMIGSDMINSNLILLPVALQQRSTCALLLHLLQPEYTTRVLEQPMLDDGVEAALETALNAMPEIVINARYVYYHHFQIRCLS